MEDKFSNVAYLSALVIYFVFVLINIKENYNLLKDFFFSDEKYEDAVCVYIVFTAVQIFILFLLFIICL